MFARKASGEEMLRLWGYRDGEEPSTTARFFRDNIASGNADFWTMDHNGELIGELYAFRDIPEDRDFADGKTTAYLCAFRIREDFRGQGLGTRLMETVLASLKAEGFRRVTIGVGPEEEQNVRLYRRMGFTGKVKDCYTDPCAMDENMRPRADDCYWLLAKDL